MLAELEKIPVVREADIRELKRRAFHCAVSAFYGSPDGAPIDLSTIRIHMTSERPGRTVTVRFRSAGASSCEWRCNYSPATGEVSIEPGSGVSDVTTC